LYSLVDSEIRTAMILLQERVRALQIA